MAIASRQAEIGVPGPLDDLLQRYFEIRADTLGLAAPLSAEDQAIQSMPDVSPTKWHLAHTTWFFEEFLLRPHVADYAVFDERFGYLFNSYYEAVGPRHPRHERGLLSRPSLREILLYRDHVDRAMERFFVSAPARSNAAYADILELGLHHEQQHQELILMDIKHVLSKNPLRPNYGARQRVAEEALHNVSWCSFPGGLYAVGADGSAFAFDNESPRHKVWLEPFKLASRLVTNGEYLAFMTDGGYRRPELWLSEGWATVNAEQWQAPLYWSGDGEDCAVFTLRGEQPLDLNEPVSHVSYFEADAFARRSGKRLPREEEWEVAASTVNGRPHLAGAGEFHPRPAPAGELVQMFGDLWEWTSSPYTAYPGFHPAAGAIGEYNGKFMCGQFVLRGGASITPEDHIRATYRNFFPPSARWAFSGVRLADDDS